MALVRLLAPPCVALALAVPACPDPLPTARVPRSMNRESSAVLPTATVQVIARDRVSTKLSGTQIADLP